MTPRRPGLGRLAARISVLALVVVSGILALSAAAAGAQTAPPIQSLTAQERPAERPAPGTGGDTALAEARQRMVEEQIRARGIRQRAVLEAMAEVPRHRFVPPAQRESAYADHPLPIGYGQTISQPFIVALTTELLDLEGDDTVLEIGTGSGYHSAVLSRIARRVYTIEIVEPLGEEARDTLARLGYDNVRVRIGDGYGGWPEEAPFDAIILTAAPPRIPEPLIDQLAVGGKLVAPVGDFLQDLLVITKTADGIERRKVAPVRFVPMTGTVRDGEEGRRR